DKPHGILNLKKVDVRIDGKISPNEYPTHFVEPKTGIGVDWVSDGKLLYVALENPGPGWVAVAFGSSKIRGTAMFIGYHDGAGGKVDEHSGFFFSTHMPVEKPKVVDFSTGKTAKGAIVEFSIPLELSNGQVIAPGMPMPFVVALNSRKQDSFRGRPTKKAAATLLLAKPEKSKAGDLKFDELDSLK
ncbi:MAG: hypothetical protein QME74_07975, partial [Candidatus Edwardsbacteria bacterium]|nr:hypothetical protein [Candidatus Edwardsbacteria bacterium]